MIARYLKSRGYRVIPVNPGHREILGEKCYGALSEIPGDVRVDIVDVFRRSSEVGRLADEAIARGAGFFFMQQGVVDREAARRLEEAGIPVAMDRCILVEREEAGGSKSRRAGMRKRDKAVAFVALARVAGDEEKRTVSWTSLQSERSPSRR